MISWNHRLGQTLRYRITHCSKFPKGDFISFLYQLAARDFRPRHVFDVGANKGRWSRRINAVFPGCTFTLIEPQAEMARHLEPLCRKVPGSRWICAGAGAEPGELELTVNPNGVSSSFTPSAEDAAAQHFQRRSVPVITLDSVVQEEGGRVPDLVKIDAEGLEPQVMDGARTLIGKAEVFILHACMKPPPPGWPTPLALWTMMEEYGYTVFDFVMFQRHRGDLAFAKIAFVRRGGRLWPG